MQPSPSHTQLDSFLKEKLLVPGTEQHPVEWSELEVMLGETRKSVSLQVTRKQMITAGMVLLAGGGIFGIYSTVRYFNSLPDEQPVVAADTSRQSFILIDTAKTAVVIPPKVDSTEADMDSIVFAAKERRSDSLLAASEALLKKTARPPDSSAAKITPPDKKQKKKKQQVIPIDSTAITTPVEEVPPPKSIEEKAPETKIASPDTSNTPSKTGKSKRGKNKKGTDPPAPPKPNADISPAKTDSIK